MSVGTLLIVGCGDIGQRVGRALAAAGWSIHAVRRTPPADEQAFHWTAADYASEGSLDFAQDLAPDVVLTSFTPTSMDLAGYRRGFAGGASNLARGLGEHRPRRVIMVSSTRVYAECDGGWVDEDAALATEDERALAIIEAERQLPDSGHNTSVVRFGGVYGDPNGRLLTRIARCEIAPAQPVRYTNRIHREDCAGFLEHLCHLAMAGEPLAAVYNGVDDNPAPAHEVESWIARRLGCSSVSTVDGSKQARNHKRCRNRRLHESGYLLRFPDYMAGYEEVCSQRN